MKRKYLIFTMLSIFAFLFTFGVKVDVQAYNYIPDAISAEVNSYAKTYYYDAAGLGGHYLTSDYDITLTLAVENPQAAGGATSQTIQRSVGVCITPMLTNPPVGHSWSGNKLRKLNNDNILKILYYGLMARGSGVETTDSDIVNTKFKAVFGHDITRAQRVILVHAAASKAYNDPDYAYSLNPNAKTVADQIYSALTAKPYPVGVYAYYGIEGDDNTQDIAFIATTLGKIKINKRSSNTAVSNGNSNYSLAGAKYRVFTNDCHTRATGIDGKEIPDLVTDENGNTQDLEVVGNRQYCIKEVEVPNPDYWEIDTTEHKCDFSYTTNGQVNNVNGTNIANDICTVTSYDAPIEEDEGKGKLNVTKVSGNPTLTNNNSYYSLAGAEFTIYRISDINSASSYATCNSNDVFGKVVTTANGKGSKNNIPEGKYCVKETKAPNNFELDTEHYLAFEVRSGISDVQQFPFTATDQPIILTNRFRIKKISSNSSVTISNAEDADYTLKGAKFAIYKGGSCSDPVYRNVQITNSAGYVDVNNLEYGTYSVRETEAPKGFIKSDDCYSIEVGSSAGTVSVSNTPKKGYITVNKKGKDDAEWSLEGAEFKLYEGESCTGSPVKTFHIKADGSTDDVAEVLFGKYSVKETKIPSNGKYEMNPNCYKVSVKESDHTTRNEPVLKEITESAKDGYGRIIKVSTTKTDKSLEGATFILCKTEEECKKDKPEVVCCELEDGQTEADRKCALVTDEKGVTNTCKLKPGVYYYKETKAPADFEINPNVRSITVEPGAEVEDECPENLIPDNPKTGIENPIMIAIAAIAIGGAGLYLNRRKNAFRQV